jgi:hypothetical protein
MLWAVGFETTMGHDAGNFPLYCQNHSTKPLLVCVQAFALAWKSIRREQLQWVEARCVILRPAAARLVGSQQMLARGYVQEPLEGGE